MASHDLINTKPTILGATLGAIPGIAANPPERVSFAPAFSERFFKNWGCPRAPDLTIFFLPGFFRVNWGQRRYAQEFVFPSFGRSSGEPFELNSY